MAELASTSNVLGQMLNLYQDIEDVLGSPVSAEDKLQQIRVLNRLLGELWSSQQLEPRSRCGPPTWTDMAKEVQARLLRP